jgi:hypothetical protein
MVRCLNLHAGVSNKNSTNYAYIYSHRPTFKVRSTFRDQLKILPHAIGHFAELGKRKFSVVFFLFRRLLFISIDYVFGVPLARNYSRIHRNVNMSYYNYSSDEENFSRQIIRYWSNFIKTGFVEILISYNPILCFFDRDPNKDFTSLDQNLIEWKSYTEHEHNYIYFQLNNIHNERNYFDTMYDFWLENFQIENTGICPKMKITKKRHMTSWMIFLFFLFFFLMIYFIWIYFQKKKRGHLLSSNRSPTALIPYPALVSA